jgi:hypothetical protein
MKPKATTRVVQVRIGEEDYTGLEKLAKHTPDARGLRPHSTISDLIRAAIKKLLAEVTP